MPLDLLRYRMKQTLTKVLTTIFHLIVGLPKRSSEWLQIRILRRHSSYQIWKIGKVTKNLVILATFPGTTSISSFRRLMQALQKQDFSVLVVMNENDLKDQFLEVLKDFDYTVFLRPNIGRDFGAYQVGFNWVYKKNADLEFEKIVILNDTLYLTPRTSDFIEYFLHQNDYNCIYLNMQGIAHASSHSIILRKNDIYSNEMKAFWKEYYPSSDRLHSVFKGEFGLTHALGINYFRPYVSPAKLSEANDALKLTDTESMQIKVWSNQSSHPGKFLIEEALKSQKYLAALTYCLENFQISNSIGLALNRLMDIPLKLDLSKQGLITRESYLKLFEEDNLDVGEIQEIKEIINVSKSGKISPSRFRIQSFLKAITESGT